MRLGSYNGHGCTQEESHIVQELGVYHSIVQNYKLASYNVGKNEITKRVLHHYGQWPMFYFWLGGCILAKDMADKMNGTIIVMDLRKHGIFVGKKECIL